MPVSDDRTAPDRWPRPLLCARCVRAPRDPDDRTTWVTLAGEQICPGCLTLDDRAWLQFDADR